MRGFECYRDWGGTATLSNSLCVCVFMFTRRVEKRSGDYLHPTSMIYDCPFQVEKGDTIKHHIQCFKRDGEDQHRDQEIKTGLSNTQQGIMGAETEAISIDVKVGEVLCS